MNNPNQLVLPNHKDEVPALFERYKDQETSLVWIFHAMVRHDRIELAEMYIRMACQDKPNRAMPLILLCYVLLLQDKKMEEMRISAQILKWVRKTSEKDADELCGQIYNAVKEAYLSGKGAYVNGLLELAMRIRPYGKKLVIAKGENAAPSYEEFKGLIEQSVRDFQAGNTALPKVLRHFNDLNVRHIDEFKGKKVLCVFRQHAYASARAREVEFFDFYEKTAKACGLDYRSFASDALVHTSSFSTDDFKNEVERLAKEIIQWRPDYVYIDNFLIHSDAEISDFVKEKFTKLKRETGCCLISFFADAWHLGQKNGLLWADELVDAHHHTQSSYIGALPQEVEDKAFCYPCPYPQELFHFPEVEKDIFAAFHGSLHDIRAPWLVKIQNDELNVHVEVSDHSNTSELSTLEAYARQFSRYDVSLLFSARNTVQTAITGAVWESLLTGSMILEEKSEEVPDYLVPYVHYIPFQSYAQLKAALTYLEQDKDLINLIRDNATSFFKTYYSAHHFWSGMLSMADNGARERENA
ncbi:hypothetical protein RYZ26_05475 [Terasakiella sp. A23]|uniref:hypothetical protein n=1 Tax=Terasakiella sp. FCG-A23 TaxID=3080561 RepID=UPI002953472F|nr:hypothetical protein [Terasakiella sp. A23]MDV7339031.1 hypothetical protein [Terasakiella sp. A23]